MTILRWARIHLAGIAEQNRVSGELSRMSDRNLADIGLSRGDVRPVARAARAGLVAQLQVSAPAGRAPATADAVRLRHA